MHDFQLNHFFPAWPGCPQRPPSKEGALYPLVPADPKKEPFARLNISMRPRLLAKIDRKAKSEGMTRSGFLALAAQNYINQLDAM